MLTTLITLFLLQAPAPPAPAVASELDSARAPAPGHGERTAARLAHRRILYNLDGDSCMFLKRGSKAAGSDHAGRLEGGRT